MYDTKKKICIIGGGLSGLATAYLLRDKFEVHVYEASHRLGGYIQTLKKDGFCIEMGPNTILNNEPKTLELISALNLNEEIIYSSERAKARYLFTRNKLFQVPSEPKDLFKSELFSFSTKIKIFLEPFFAPKYSEADENKTIVEVIKDHFGEQAAGEILRSAIVGIYGGDANKLSVKLCLPRLLEIKKNSKSLIKAFKDSQSDSEKSKSIGLKSGFETLIKKLSEKIEDIHFSSEVTKIEKSENKFKIHIQEPEDSIEKDYDYVVCTTHGQKTYSLLKPFLTAQELEQLQKITFAPIRVFAVGFKKPLNFKGFGTLVNPADNKNILGFLHPKDIFDGRCPENKDFLIIMMGGVFKPEVLKMSTERAIDLALKDLREIIGELPGIEFIQMSNHQPGIVQYNLENKEVFEMLDKKIKSIPGLYFNSTLLGGVSVNDCIRKAYTISDAIKN